MSSPKRALKRIARAHLQVPTLDVRQSDRLDFHTVSVLSIKDALEAAFDAGAREKGKRQSAIDVAQLLEQRHQVGVIWSIEDVQAGRPDLDNNQAWEVLKQCRKVHDCEYGFTWMLIETVAEDLFPSSDKGDGQ